MNKVYIMYDYYYHRGDVIRSVYTSRDAAMAALEKEHSELSAKGLWTRPGAKYPKHPERSTASGYKGPDRIYTSKASERETFHAHFSTGLFDDDRKRVCVEEYRLEDVQ
jgi:hypothetical protein